MTAFMTEEDIRAAVAEARAGLARAGRAMDAAAEAMLVTFLRGGLEEQHYARLDAGALELELE